MRCRFVILIIGFIDGLSIGRERFDEEKKVVDRNRFPACNIFVSVSVGAPPKLYWLNAQTGSENLWLLDKKYPHLESGHTTYDPAGSSTCKPTNDYLYDSCAQTNFSGQQYFDYVRIEKHTTKTVSNSKTEKFEWGQNFGSIEHIVDPFEQHPQILFDGIIGLAWNPNETYTQVDKYSPPILNILSSYRKRFYSVWTSLLANKQLGFQTYGEVTFGEINAMKCEKEISYVPLKYNYHLAPLSFNVDEFVFGKYKVDSKTDLGKVDTALSLIYLPSAHFNEVIKQLSVNYDDNYNVYTMLCSDINQQQLKATFKIGANDYELTSSDYVVDIKLPDNQCALAFAESDQNIEYTFGIPFTLNYCQIFDVDLNQLGFSKAIHKS